jgi:predicted ATPase
MNATMNLTAEALKRAVTLVVAGTLGLWSTAGSTAPVRMHDGYAVMSQYCAPPDDGADIVRFYCGHPHLEYVPVIAPQALADPLAAAAV